MPLGLSIRRRGPGLGHVLSYFGRSLPGHRPALIIYVPLKYYVFGTDMGRYSSLGPSAWR